MKAWLPILLLSACACLGQGTFIFDQQSSTDETAPGVNLAGARMPAYPDSGTGQTFIPSLSSVSFVRLLLSDADTSDSIGAVVYLNLRSGLDGPVLGTSSSITMLNRFNGAQTFYFPAPVTVTPGSTYYFEAVEQTGGPWSAVAGQYAYAGGTAFLNGSPLGNQNFWFREGIIVPEPSSLGFLVMGAGALWFHRRSHFS